DIASRLGSVRFTPESGQTADISVCPLCAKSGQMHRNKRRARIVEIYSVTATDAGDFAERDLWNIQSSNPDQLILAPANLITFAHFSVYSAMNVANSAGELANTVPPRSAIRAFIRGSARPALISLLSLSMISAGVFLGAPTPCQPVPS